MDREVEPWGAERKDASTPGFNYFSTKINQENTEASRRALAGTAAAAAVTADEPVPALGEPPSFKLLLVPL